MAGVRTCLWWSAGQLMGLCVQRLVLSALFLGPLPGLPMPLPPRQTSTSCVWCSQTGPTLPRLALSSRMLEWAENPHPAGVLGATQRRSLVTEPIATAILAPAVGSPEGAWGEGCHGQGPWATGWSKHLFDEKHLLEAPKAGTRQGNTGLKPS